MSNEWGTWHGGVDRSPLRNVTNVSKSEDSGDGGWGKTYGDNYGDFNGPLIYAGQTDHATHTDDYAAQAGSASKRDNPAHQHHASEMRGECYGCGQVGHNKADCPKRSRGAGAGSGGGYGECYNGCGAGHNKTNWPEPRAKSGECYNCVQTGHNKADWHNEKVGQAFTGTCNMCAQVGHRSADCPTAPPRLDRNCGELRHTSKSCPAERRRYVLPATIIHCYNCNGEGHLIRDCPQQCRNKDVCRNCDEVGHVASECPQPRHDSRVQCKTCKMGHTAMRRGITGGDGGGDGGARDSSCRSCGEEGHWSTDCSNERAMKCHNCDGPHISKDCPEPRDYSRVECRNCNQKGNTVARCPESQFGSGHASFGGNDYGSNNYHGNHSYSGIQAEDRYGNDNFFFSDSNGAAQPENRWSSGPAESDNDWAASETQYDHGTAFEAGISYSRTSENGSWESRGNNTTSVRQTSWKKTPKAAPLTLVSHAGSAMPPGDFVKTHAPSPVESTNADADYAAWNTQISQPAMGASKDFGTPAHGTGNNYSSRLAPNRHAGSGKTSGGNSRDTSIRRPSATPSASPYTGAAHDRAAWNNSDSLVTAAVSNEAETKTYYSGHLSRPVLSRHAESRNGPSNSRDVIAPRPSTTPSATSYTAPSTYDHGSLPIRGPNFVHSPPPKGEGQIIFDGPASESAIMDDDKW